MCTLAIAASTKSSLDWNSETIRWCGSGGHIASTNRPTRPEQTVAASAGSSSCSQRWMSGPQTPALRVSTGARADDASRLGRARAAAHQRGRLCGGTGLSPASARMPGPPTPAVRVSEGRRGDVACVSRGPQRTRKSTSHAARVAVRAPALTPVFATEGTRKIASSASGARQSKRGRHAATHQVT